MKKLFSLILISMLFLLNNESLTAQISQKGVDIDGEFAGDQSGFAVSLSEDGQRVAIGSPENDDNNTDSGQVRVYEWNGSAWIQLGDDIEGSAKDSELGTALVLSSDGNRLVVGAPFNDNEKGYVRTYEWDGVKWDQKGSDITGKKIEDRLGFSLALSTNDSRLIIGAPTKSGVGAPAGYAQVYQWNGQTWEQIGDDLPGEFGGDEFGFDVSISADGNRAAVSSPYNDGFGHVRVYSWNGMLWQQLGEDIVGETLNDNSGTGIDLSSDGNLVAIGAINNDGNGSLSGHVRVHEWNGTSWQQLGADIDGDERAGAGWAVAFHPDGNRLAVGSPASDNAGLNVGSVRIYEWNNSNWMPIGSDLNGEADADLFGYALDFSAEGNDLVIGGIANDGNGNNAGHVRVFEGFNIPSNITGLVEGEPAFKLFPNPASDQVNLSIHHLADYSNKQIAVNDMMGKVLFTIPAQPFHTIPLKHLMAGSYTVILKDKDSGEILEAETLVVGQ